MPTHFNLPGVEVPVGPDDVVVEGLAVVVVRSVVEGAAEPGMHWLYQSFE